MKKEQVLTRLKEDCLVAVVRAKNLEQGEKVVDAIIEGGINFIEITMTMDEGNPVEFIAAMANSHRCRYCSGSGDCKTGDFSRR